MGRIGKLLSFVRAVRNSAQVSDVKLDPGGGPVITAEHFSAPGDDSHPLAGDYVRVGQVPQSGRAAVTGYVDPATEPKAQPGEKRIYARDTDGAEVAEVWLKNDSTVTAVNSNGSVTLSPDGSILGQNSSGSFELQASGDFVVNGVTIAADGSVTIPTSLTLNGKEIAGHTHPITSGSSAPGPTGPNN